MLTARARQSPPKPPPLERSLARRKSHPSAETGAIGASSVHILLLVLSERKEKRNRHGRRCETKNVTVNVNAIKSVSAQSSLNASVRTGSVQNVQSVRNVNSAKSRRPKRRSEKRSEPADEFVVRTEQNGQIG